MSATPTAMLRTAWVECPSAVDGAVDEFDATARLESQGIGDAVAARAGHPDVFSLAGAWLADAAPPAANDAVAPSAVWSALARGIIVMAGVVICLMLIPISAWGGTALVAGASSWIAGQAISASVWWGKGAGRDVEGHRGALVVGAVLIAAATAIAAAVGEPAILGWAAWGCSVGVALASVDNVRLSFFCVSGAVVAVAGLALPAWQCAPAALVVGVMAAWAVRTLVRGSGGGWRWRPAGGQVVLIGLAVAQTLAYLYFLLVLVRLIGVEFPIVMWAGLISTASSEPLLEWASVATRRLAAAHDHWRRLRRATALAGACTIMMVALVGVGTGAIVSVVVAGRLPSPGVMSATLAVGVLTSGCGVLLRTGSAAGAAGLTIVGAVAVTLVPPAAGWFALVAAVAGCGLTAVISARQFASPRSW